MINKIKTLNGDAEILPKLIVLFLSLFSACCVLVSLIFPYFKMYEELSVGRTLIAFAATIAYAVCLFHASQKVSLKVLKCIIAGIVFLVSICQMLVVFNMQLIPNVDLSHVYDQVMFMLENSSPVLTDKNTLACIPITYRLQS